MSFFSRKKQQPPPQPPANVTVAQTPSQALAQLSSNASKDVTTGQGQPGSLRENQFDGCVSPSSPNFSPSFTLSSITAYPEVSEVVVWVPVFSSNRYSSNKPKEPKIEEIVRMGLQVHFNHCSSSSGRHLPFHGLPAASSFYPRLCFPSLESYLPHHPHPHHFLDTATHFLLSPLLEGISTFSVVLSEKLLATIFICFQRRIIQQLYCRRAVKFLVPEWVTPVPWSAQF